MTKEAGWKQFMTTGKVEDYLQFKAIIEDTGSKKDTKGENSHAGFDQSNRDCFK